MIVLSYSVGGVDESTTIEAGAVVSTVMLWSHVLYIVYPEVRGAANSVYFRTF